MKNEIHELIFDTTLPEGDSSGKKLLNLARMVFPRNILEVYYSALLDKPSAQVFTRSLLNKFRYSKDSEAEITFDQRMDSQKLDVVYGTDKGYFVIKDFKDQVVTSDELKKFLDTIAKQFSKIFRVIIVSKDYEPKLKGESEDEQLKELLKYKFPFDLIVEENIGYTVLRIGGF